MSNECSKPPTSLSSASSKSVFSTSRLFANGIDPTGTEGGSGPIVEAVGVADPVVEAGGAVDPVVEAGGAVDPVVEAGGAVDPVVEAGGAVDLLVEADLVTLGAGGVEYPVLCSVVGGPDVVL